MSTSLETYIRQLSPDGLRVTIWPVAGDGFQVNVAERTGGSWTCVREADPVYGLQEALRLRATGHRGREVIFAEDDGMAEPEQLDIEDAIACGDLPAMSEAVIDYLQNGLAMTANPAPDPLQREADSAVPVCSECRLPQFDSPSGTTCPNGHGGADSAYSDDFEGLL